MPSLSPTGVDHVGERLARYQQPLPSIRPVHWWTEIFNRVNALIAQEGVPPRWDAVQFPWTDQITRGPGNSTTASIYLTIPPGWEEGTTVYYNLMWVLGAAAYQSPNSPKIEARYQWLPLNATALPLTGARTFTNAFPPPTSFVGNTTYAHELTISATGVQIGSVLRIFWARQTDSLTHTIIFNSSRLLYERSGGAVRRYSKQR